jgi:hypothetical protein
MRSRPPVPTLVGIRPAPGSHPALSMQWQVPVHMGLLAYWRTSDRSARSCGSEPQTQPGAQRVVDLVQHASGLGDWERLLDVWTTMKVTDAVSRRLLTERIFVPRIDVDEDARRPKVREPSKVHERELVPIPIWHVDGTKFRAINRQPVETRSDLGVFGGRDRRRSGDLTLFRRALYQLSYPTGYPGSIVMKTDRIWWRT